MASRIDKSEGLSLRSRLAIFDGTSVSAETACTMEESEITYDLLMRSGVRAVNLLVGSYGPTILRGRGVESATQLRQLGFDALHLCDPDFCNEASMAYGAKGVVEAFLASAQDAVAIAGSEAMHILNLEPKQLLEHCAGFPGEALAVLEQLPQGVSLHGVSCGAVLDSGLRANSLVRCGYGLTAVVTQLAPTGSELQKLGYTV